LRHNAELEENGHGDVNAKYRDSLARGVGGHESDNNDGLPIYIQAGSPEESHWRQTHPSGHKSALKSFTTGSTNAHVAAREGKVEDVQEEIKKNKAVVNAKDENGWGPIHEVRLIFDFVSRVGLSAKLTSQPCLRMVLSGCERWTLRSCQAVGRQWCRF
jgi:hypothetical protein